VPGRGLGSNTLGEGGGNGYVVDDAIFQRTFQGVAVDGRRATWRSGWADYGCSLSGVG